MSFVSSFGYLIQESRRQGPLGLPAGRQAGRPARSKVSTMPADYFLGARINQADDIGPLTRRLAQKSKRIVIGFVPSTLYGSLPDVIRTFRETQQDVELSLQ